MKKNIKFAAVLMAASLIFSSCIGSFSLFNSYAKWQRTMTNNKFVNAIVGFVLMPICGSISILVDSLVLNTIEFWSGENPMSANVGGAATCTGGAIRQSLALCETAQVVICDYNYVFDPKVRLKRFFDRSGRYTLLIDEAHNLTDRAREMYSALLDGQQLRVTPDEAGLYEVRTAAFGGNFFAMR